MVDGSGDDDDDDVPVTAPVVPVVYVEADGAGTVTVSVTVLELVGELDDDSDGRVGVDVLMIPGGGDWVGYPYVAEDDAVPVTASVPPVE